MLLSFLFLFVYLQINTPESPQKITHLVFDIDDTMYSVKNGFTTHRTEVALSYMTDELGFENKSIAKEFRDEHFAKHHSMLKLFTVTSESGLLPPTSDGSIRKFDPVHFSQYYENTCQFEHYLKPNSKFIDALQTLVEIKDLKLIVFTNGPKQYGLRVLKAIGVDSFFKPENIFAVEDVMPTPKPHVSSFEKVLLETGCSDATQAVMFEDSMKNIQSAKSIGMKTVLILASDELVHDGGDVPLPNDASVDIVLSDAGELREKLPCLWDRKWIL